MNTDVESRVRSANPLTRDEQLDRLFGDDVSRRLRRDIYARTEGRMMEINQQQTREETAGGVSAESQERPSPIPPKKPRLVLVAAVVAAVVAAGVVIAIATGGEEGPPPATQDPQPATTLTPPTEATVTPTPAELEAVGERFVDAYVSADLDAVRAAVPGAELGAVPYLIGWNQAANYEVVDRPRCAASDGFVSCTIAGRDDVWSSLGVGFTETFTLTQRDGQIRTVEWSVAWSDELLAQDFQDWLRATDPGLFASGGACQDFFNGGPTPGDCARAWVEATSEYESAKLESLAEEFVDAFVAQDAEALQALVSPVTDVSDIVYVMGMGVPLNYSVVERTPCTARLDNGSVTCAVTGRDDLWDALGYRFTDSFTMTAPDGEITTVEWNLSWTPADEPFTAWVFEAHPELFQDGGPCERFFRRGETPGDCALAWFDLVDDFKAAETG